LGHPFVRAREAEHEHEQVLAESFAAAQVSDEDDVSRDQGGGEGAITRRPAGGPRSWSAAMIAADTVASESETDGTNGEPSWTRGGSSRQGALASEGEPAWMAGDESEGEHGPDSNWSVPGRGLRGRDDTSAQPATATPVSGTGWPGQASAYGSVPEYREAEQFWTPDDWSERQAAYRQLWGPPGRRLAPRQALGQPYVWDGGRSDPDEIERAADDSDREPEPSAAIRPRHSADPLTGFAPTTESAVIGDELRELAAWCQIGACIARYADPQALGEVDIRRRAVSAGWCVDLFGRLICPSCQQTIPVWSALPLVGRDRAAGQPPVTAEAQFGRHRRIRWPTPRGVDPVP
jgi:hypothetical protein